MAIRAYISIFLAVVFLGLSLTAEAQQISEKESARLKTFLQRRLGSRLPAKAKIEVKGFTKSEVQGFKEGKFIVESLRGSGDVPFLLSKDNKYMIMGEPIDLRAFKPGRVKGLKEGKGGVGRQNVPMLLTDDGNFLIISELIDTTINPLADIVNKISLVDVPLKGNKKATVTIVEYSDFQCPYCKRAADMLPKLLEEYKDKIRIVYKQFPLPNHNWAKPASIASVCAYKQDNDKFWEYHDLIFSNQRKINLGNSEVKFNEFAKQLGLDENKFQECIKSPTTRARVEREYNEAQIVGVNSTPSFYVNGMSVRGADLKGLKSAIDMALAGM